MANTKENPKEECKIVVTMSQGRETVEKKEEKNKWNEVKVEAELKKGQNSLHLENSGLNLESVRALPVPGR